MSEQELNKRRCIQYLTREYTEEERITFEIDVLFDEELKSTYETYSLLWKAYPTNREIWQEAKEQSQRKKQANSWYIRVACTILVLISSFIMTYLLVQPTVNPADAEYRIYTNVPGVRKQITLEDGSVVVLNGQARLQYTQNDSMRLAWLEGEAFFDVVKNVNKKFVVKHEDLAIEVVGTQFSVNTLGQEKCVALLSGKVLAKLGNGEQLYLKPNEQLVWNTSLGEVKRFKTNAAQQMSWRNETLIFDNTPLAQALIQINQFYGVTFVIQDPVFAQKRITGVFDQVTLEEFIQALAFVTNCTITLNNTNYLIEPYAQYPLSKSSPKPEDDLVLFQEIAQGNRLAFERFYVKYYQYLCRFALSYEKDLYLVEEKVSDVFYYIWQKKEELSKIENPKVYVFTMTKNMLFQQKKITRKTMLDLEFETVEHKHYVSTIEDDIIQSEQEADLRQALLHIIDKIPPKSRRIFEMSRIDGLKYQQIADILELSVKTIENHMHIALKTISLALTQTNKTK